MKVMVEVEVEEIAEQIIKQLAESGDVIQVVRCKDCKHGEPWTYMHKKEYVTCGVDCEEIDRESDFFCAYGERRSE